MNLHAERLKSQMDMDRRARHLRRMWYHFCEDAGEFVAEVVGLILCVLALAVLWMAIVQVEQWLKGVIK